MISIIFFSSFCLWFLLPTPTSQRSGWYRIEVEYVCGKAAEAQTCMPLITTDSNLCGNASVNWDWFS